MNKPGVGRIPLFLAAGLVIGIGLGAAIFFGGGTGRQSRDMSSSAQVGQLFPDFEAETMDGNQFKFSELSQKAVVINFWATWCEPCKEEMPLLDEYAEKFPQIEILAINYDEPLQSVQRYINNNGIGLLILMDPGGKIASQFRVFGFPTTFFIDAEGIFQANHIGQLNAQLMDLYLEKIGITP